MIYDAYELYKQSIKSPATLRSYDIGLKSFLKFSEKKKYDDLIFGTSKDIEALVIDYIIHLKQRIEHGDFRASSCRPYFFALKIFYEQNDIILNWKKLQRMLPEVGETTGDKPYTTEDIEPCLMLASSVYF